MTSELEEAPARTPLYSRHIALGGRMVEFAGYALPVHYSKGVLSEHLFTRAKAGLFDVSHMGQAFLSGRDAARKLERLVPGDLLALEPGRIRYTQFTNEQGGILDDLMVTRLAPNSKGERLFLVVNAACKAADFAHLRAKLPDLRLDVLEDRALLPCRGRRPPPCWTAMFPASPRSPSCRRASSTGATRKCPFPARAIPARTASRFPCPPTPPARSPTPCCWRRMSSPSGWAPQFAAARSGAVPLRP